MTDKFRITGLPRNHWPLFVLLLVAGFLALTAWSFHLAASGASAVTDHDYYRHGLRFDQTQLEQQAAASLGWTTEISLVDRQLRVLLTDRTRQPVTAARGRLTMTGSNHDEVYHLALAEHTAGSYTGRLPAELRGENSAQIDFERDGARLSKRLLISLP